MMIYIFFILGLVIFLLLIYICNKNQNQIQKINSKDDTIKTLVRQAARWSVAASQDENVMVAVLHANYGAGYLWALKDIATDNEIVKATGINILKFRDDITRIQDISTRKMAALCPSFAPSQTYLTKVAGLQ